VRTCFVIGAGKLNCEAPALEWCRLLCRFSAAGNNETLPALKRPAAEKRQGTKSREVGH